MTITRRAKPKKTATDLYADGAFGVSGNWVPGLAKGSRDDLVLELHHQRVRGGSPGQVAARVPEWARSMFPNAESWKACTRSAEQGGVCTPDPRIAEKHADAWWWAQCATGAEAAVKHGGGPRAAIEQE